MVHPYRDGLQARIKALCESAPTRDWTNQDVANALGEPAKRVATAMCQLRDRNVLVSEKRRGVSRGPKCTFRIATGPVQIFDPADLERAVGRMSVSRRQDPNPSEAD